MTMIANFKRHMCGSPIIQLAILSVFLFAMFYKNSPIGMIKSEDPCPEQNKHCECPAETNPVSVSVQSKTATELEYELVKKSVSDVRVLCWIMTGPENHQKKAIHIKRTWGQRCNKLLFFSSANDSEIPTIGLKDVKEGRDYLWAKTKEAFLYVYKNHLDEADFFMKADDDTYVIVENLRFLLKDYDPINPIYFGCRFKPFVKQGYMSGGAGYILSKGALKAFVEIALKDPEKCTTDHSGNEDVEMGKCLENVGVKAEDSRDSLGRYRFFPFPADVFLQPGLAPDWYLQYIYHPQKAGIECCSHSAISFHYITPNQMYALDFLIYHLRPFGVNPQEHEESQKQIYELQSTSPST